MVIWFLFFASSRFKPNLITSSVVNNGSLDKSQQISNKAKIHEFECMLEVDTIENVLELNAGVVDGWQGIDLRRMRVEISNGRESKYPLQQTVIMEYI